MYRPQLHARKIHAMQVAVVVCRGRPGMAFKPRPGEMMRGWVTVEASLGLAGSQPPTHKIRVERRAVEREEMWKEFARAARISHHLACPSRGMPNLPLRISTWLLMPLSSSSSLTHSSLPPSIGFLESKREGLEAHPLTLAFCVSWIRRSFECETSFHQPSLTSLLLAECKCV